jgi:hypothetical protein
MTILRRTVAVLLLASPLVAVGCKQGVGDRCNIQSDCGDGLYCFWPTNNYQTGGTCLAPTTTTDMTVTSSTD